MSAIEDIAAERQRQIRSEGWSPDHDDEHDGGELAAAAACYAGHAANTTAENVATAGLPPGEWPWDLNSWKPSTARRDLVKAGALIVAEIERLDRAAHTEAALERARQTCNS